MRAYRRCKAPRTAEHSQQAGIPTTHRTERGGDAVQATHHDAREGHGGRLPLRILAGSQLRQAGIEREDL